MFVFKDDISSREGNDIADTIINCIDWDSHKRNSLGEAIVTTEYIRNNNGILVPKYIFGAIPEILALKEDRNNVYIAMVNSLFYSKLGTKQADLSKGMLPIPKSASLQNIPYNAEGIPLSGIKEKENIVYLYFGNSALHKIAEISHCDRKDYRAKTQ